jgi:uncharacterized protein (DUF362 family)/Pyruvate/2-oxoacid:ferredoxin oxidoreductase delta subunit
MFKVMIHPATYDKLDEAVSLAFETFPLNLRRKKVFIKPNVLRGSEARECVVTNPAVLRAVVRKVETMNPASIVVGDNPGIFSYGANEAAFEKTGLMEAADGYYQNIGHDSRMVPFNPDFLPSVSVSRIVFDADIIISLPKFKTHGLTVVTGAIKNSYGFLPGAQKAKLHMAAGSIERFHDMVVEVFKIRPPDLFIVDAVVGMEGNGPASPDLRNIGMILASDNAVAMDGVIATMMGCEPRLLRFLRKAKESGLGDYDPANMEVIGELRKILDFKRPPLGGEALLNNEPMQAALHSKTIMRPHVDPDLCTSCGACIGQCPPGALAMGDRTPEVNTGKCITCFCCQEICPSRAIALR